MIRAAKSEEELSSRYQQGKLDQISVLGSTDQQKPGSGDARILRGGDAGAGPSEQGVASKKNLRLYIEGRSVLQFFKTKNGEFQMHVSWPLSPLQAFGICISAMV